MKWAVLSTVLTNARQAASPLAQRVTRKGGVADVTRIARGVARGS